MRTQIKIQQQLNEAYDKLDADKYIANSPVQFIRQIANRPNAIMSDTEFCAILSAMVAWGQPQKSIEAAKSLMDMCEWEPTRYIYYGDFYDIPDDKQIYRTLKGKEFKAVLHTLRQWYDRHGSIADVIAKNTGDASFMDLFYMLCQWFAPAHMGNPDNNSACKRITLLLRWMIRKDEIDLGIWQSQRIKPSDLYAVLDTATCRQALHLGLVTYPKESWKAVEELTDVFRHWDATDPIKYNLVFNSNNL